MSNLCPVPRRRLPAVIALAGAFTLGLCVLVAACDFGGGDDDALVARTRSGPVPTATLPANLPEPLLLGQVGAAPATTPGAGAAGNTYTVRSGDTLFGIAASLGIPPAEQGAWANEVLRLNGIQDASRLMVGAELRLPAQTARAATPAPTPASPVAPTATVAAPTPRPPSPPAATNTPAPASTPTVPAGSGTYTVQPGDFPHLIAEKLGVPQSQWIAWSNELIALNNINPNAMQVGQVLRLPASTPGR